MKIGGMGEEALRVEYWELRRLHELPAEVQIVEILPDLPAHSKCVYVDGGAGVGPAPVEMFERRLPPEWIPHPLPLEPLKYRAVYLHIQHRYCLRVPAGAALSYGSLDGFLRRYAGIEADERAAAGKPVPENHHSNVWVDDDV